MAPGDRLRLAREQLELTREEFASRLEDFSENRVYFLETGRTKVTTGLASRICATFGLSVRWLLDGEGEMMIDEQHLKTLQSELYERGVMGKEQMEMLEVLREFGIKDPEMLRDLLRSAKEIRAVASRLPKYEVKKKT